MQPARRARLCVVYTGIFGTASASLHVTRRRDAPDVRLDRGGALGGDRIWLARASSHGSYWVATRGPLGERGGSDSARRVARIPLVFPCDRGRGSANGAY